MHKQRCDRPVQYEQQVRHVGKHLFGTAYGLRSVEAGDDVKVKRYRRIKEVDMLVVAEVKDAWKVWPRVSGNNGGPFAHHGNMGETWAYMIQHRSCGEAEGRGIQGEIMVFEGVATPH